MWAVSEGSLSPTMEVNLETERSQRGDKGRGEQERVGKGGGGGSESFARGNQEGIRIRDLRGDGGGRQVTCGRVS